MARSATSFAGKMRCSIQTLNVSDYTSACLGIAKVGTGQAMGSAAPQARGALETARTGNAFSQILPETRIAGGNPALVAACQTTAIACTNGSPPCEISTWVTARSGCV